MLGPLLCKIFLNNLLFTNLRSIVCNFAGDSTLHYCGEITENIINILQADLKVVLRWFSNNQIMASAGKLQYMLLGKQKALKIETEGLKLESAK